MSDQTKSKTQSKRGFASMCAEKRRAVSSLGGKSVPPEKRSFSRDKVLAACAGRKGGSSILSPNQPIDRTENESQPVKRSKKMACVN